MSEQHQHPYEPEVGANNRARVQQHKRFTGQEIQHLRSRDSGDNEKPAFTKKGVIQKQAIFGMKLHISLFKQSDDGVLFHGVPRSHLLSITCL